MKTKIAPITRALLSDLWAEARSGKPTKEKAGRAQVLRIAEAEIRTLLAVARAAERMERLAYDGDWQAACEPLFRALARLAKRAR